jgi:hypothetical protein
MNMNRLRPTGVKDLELWLSGVIHDAIRDCLEAGMDQQTAHQLLKTITKMHHPLGRMGVEFDRKKDSNDD